MNERSPKENRVFNGAWLAIGIGVGVVIGAATKNVALWICIGVALGTALSFAVPKMK